MSSITAENEVNTPQDVVKNEPNNNADESPVSHSPPTTTTSCTEIKVENDIDETLQEEEEEVDEEDAFFTKIEEEDHIKEEASHDHTKQPHSKESAPTLLRDALKTGKVQPDDSETDEEKKDESGKNDGEGGIVKEEEGGDDEKKDHHVHARVSSVVLDCFCSLFGRKKKVIQNSNDEETRL